MPHQTRYNMIHVRNTAMSSRSCGQCWRDGHIRCGPIVPRDNQHRRYVDDPVEKRPEDSLIVGVTGRCFHPSQSPEYQGELYLEP